MRISALYIFLMLQTCWAYEYYDDDPFHLYLSRRGSEKDYSLNQTFFSSLEHYQVGAEQTSESKYPWIARVIHSRDANKPHMCTAVCVDQRIFITAARCIYSLKVYYTTIIYSYERHHAIAFVVPKNGSKQAFDDIGFIVVEMGYSGPWHKIQLFHMTNRTDDHFEWFADLELPSNDYIVVGYATEKGIHRIKAAERLFTLTELPIVVDINICKTILTFKQRIRGFHVPCYHSCSLEQFQNEDLQCQNYHGVEGGAIIHAETNMLLGVASWGPYFHKYELPVGFIVPNSKDFFRDYECAKRIMNDNVLLFVDGYYQALCENDS